MLKILAIVACVISATAFAAKSPCEPKVKAPKDYKPGVDPAYEKVKAAGLAISSSGRCHNKYKSSCTSLDGIKEGTVDAAVALSKAYFKKTGKSLVITGGTECNHAHGEKSHWTGYKVDFRAPSIGDPLVKFINATYKRDGARSNGDPVWISENGKAKFCFEKTPPHVDVTFND